MSLKTSFEHWLKNSLEQSSPLLGGMPVCPYAREARLKNLIEFHEVESAADFFATVTQHLMRPLEKEVIVVACADYKNVSLPDLGAQMHAWREKFAARDLWVMADHPDLPELCEGLVFNHGGAAFIFIQKLSALVEKSRTLEAKGYYRLWPQDYYNKVVSLRHAYYEKHVASLVEARV